MGGSLAGTLRTVKPEGRETPWNGGTPGGIEAADVNMYASRGFMEWEIGDIDVVRRGRKFHLFHLVLPNHDYIAHAISEDGLNWKRTRNAIFTGEPGAWDDDMLWTMHVSQHPVSRIYEMFYTGLNRAENGNYQRIGRAVSRDLRRWHKELELNLPLLPSGPAYELPAQSGRGWVSFRDPFLFRQEDQDWLLLCARVPEGPVNRRGCVGLVRRTPGGYEVEPPLFYPRMYDDVECPCLVELGGTCYLLGSIREELAVRYWWSDRFRGEYRSFNPNLLLPLGNYAARIMRDGPRLLLFSFYVNGLDAHAGARSLPPPKEVRQRADGRLELVSYHRWNLMKRSARPIGSGDFRAVLDNPTALCEASGDHLRFSCRSGFEVFALAVPEASWVWEMDWQTFRQGACGIVFALDDRLSAYFIDLDTERGSARIRAWGCRPERVFQNYIFESLQSCDFTPIADRRYALRLVRWGSYLELSVNGVVRLSLVDSRFTGRSIGIYLESAEVALAALTLNPLEDPAHDFG
jgi:beta-fructofuranosidase